ncbi:putative Replication factor C subunit 3 [Paratrimastix pyriformis]|uniref:Replication factor C subunit 3 n=1 Tax=Paratrimastix pyriformis TaxID=342808 RepID=A0ABQ8URC9_9EUKA|nr:putative Replication factor C subunit 3 [Paratrimastix pyriformis]
MLFIDKYRPTTLDKLDYQKDMAQRLERMLDSSDFPHLLFYGPFGAGKKTRVSAVLRHVFGPSVDKLKVENRAIPKPGSSGTVDITTISSPHHIELTPSDVGTQDRLVVMELIKEIASSRPLEITRAMGGGPQEGEGRGRFKVVVLNEVDHLTRAAQHALRRTMERYMSTCRLILCCQSTSKLIDPLKSRCLCIRVAAPTNDEILAILNDVAHKERMVLPPRLATRIVEAGQRNLRRSLLMLEACRVAKYPLEPDQEITTPDWERFLVDTARGVVEEQSAQKLLVTRKRLYELLVNCIPPEVIFQRLANELLRKCDSELRAEVAHWAAFFEHRLQQGTKPIVHLEAFLAKFMAIYKRYSQRMTLA